QLGVLAHAGVPDRWLARVDEMLDRPGQHGSTFRPIVRRRARRSKLIDEDGVAPGETSPRRDGPDETLLVAEHRNSPSSEQPHGAVGDSLEDRLDVGLGLADHAKDLTRRQLALEGSGQPLVESSALPLLLVERLPERIDLGVKLSLAGRGHRVLSGLTAGSPS